jgi:hypothetical protein
VATGAVALAGAVGFGCATTLVVALGLLAGAPLVHEDRMRALVSAAIPPIRHLFLAPRRLLGINLVPPLFASNRSYPRSRFSLRQSGSYYLFVASFSPYGRKRGNN